mmetsp:Transcript_88131/g.221845  ORF Transcript_88131/g.221845 Transcript_88131/m.221845 type:complete len:212 (+) Transcript_88131:1566-2201(+)
MMLQNWAKLTFAPSVELQKRSASSARHLSDSLPSGDSSEPPSNRASNMAHRSGSKTPPEELAVFTIAGPGLAELAELSFGADPPPKVFRFAKGKVKWLPELFLPLNATALAHSFWMCACASSRPKSLGRGSDAVLTVPPDGPKLTSRVTAGPSKVSGSDSGFFFVALLRGRAAHGADTQRTPAPHAGRQPKTTLLFFLRNDRGSSRRRSSK